MQRFVGIFQPCHSCFLVIGRNNAGHDFSPSEAMPARPLSGRIELPRDVSFSFQPVQSMSVNPVFNPMKIWADLRISIGSKTKQHLASFSA